jgi:hypothetical protein
MVNYDFGQSFRAIYLKAVDLYGQNQRGADTFFREEELAFLNANGITAQHLYDYAEDHSNYDEPGFEIALGIEMVRRDYFLNVQDGERLGKTANPVHWPAKSETVKGMVCCGGDRQFFKISDIHPAEFLALVWRMGDNDKAIIDWVENRSAAQQSA